MENAELIKALRCKECFDLCNVESCRYHITNTKSGCKCAIKLMAADAADALEAAEKRIAELEAAQRWIPCSERLPEEYEEEDEVLTLDVHGFVEGFTASHIPAWNEHHQSHKITHWQPLPQLPQKG